MLWRSGRESDNVEDQRGFGGKTIGVGAVIVGAIVYTLMGGNPLDYLAQNVGNITTQSTQQAQKTNAPVNDDQKKFVAVVLGDTEDVWVSLFRQSHQTYSKPKLVLFTGAVQSACGQASSAMGPFYCPGDQKVYLDLSFFNELSNRLGAKGDFARAYVVAHEVGHHVQNLLGLTRNQRVANQTSVQIELQADCFAGVWAKQTESNTQQIEPGDIESALTAASAVGDDRLQKMSRGQVVPDSFTHGSSEQRMSAFKLGYAKGAPQDCIDGFRTR